MHSEEFQGLRGHLANSESMGRYTSWRVGGLARQFYKPADIADLARFLQQLPKDETIIWVGLGSNLLVRDGGIDGTVIYTGGALTAIEQTDDHIIRAEAGVPCARLARFCARMDMAGGEFFTGIPGTLGGALRMNAGAFGGETWALVRSVETIHRSGQCHHRDAREFKVGYRHVESPAAEWFVAAFLKLAPGYGKQTNLRIKELLQQRSASQPVGKPSCGSVFRNPPGDYAGRLIEASGLKGFQLGGARVSEKHANFIINTGMATAQDIESLINHVAATVWQKYGVRLQREVHIIGRRPAAERAGQLNHHANSTADSSEY